MFDSGLGGISVLGEALRGLPGEDYVYFGDTRHIPYGDKPPDEVLRYTHEAVDKLIQLDCKAIVLACNKRGRWEAPSGAQAAYHRHGARA